MYVRNIRIGTFRQLRDMELGPFPAPLEQSDVVVLAGPNGGGKTSVLELLSYALSSTYSLQYGATRQVPPDNSFEVALAMDPTERQMVIDVLRAQNNHGAAQAIAYLEANDVMYRNWNFPAGEYFKDTESQNHIYNMAIAVIRDQVDRSSGFFLRADRQYPKRVFSREAIFQYAQMRLRSHADSLAYTVSDMQFAGMYDYLTQQRYHYFADLGAYEHAISLGNEPGRERPTDPLIPYDELLERSLGGYRFSDQGSEIPSDLMVDQPAGFSVSFSDLSSGEKEVFFALAFFIKQNVTRAVILIDEPELHLHPELARRLVRLMRTVRPYNQIFAATHNAEVIEEAGRDRVYYLARSEGTAKATLTSATDETESAKLLRDLFGYSGYIGIAHTIVFLEGIESSADRKVFTSMFPDATSVKFVPAGGVDMQKRLNAAIMAILEGTLGYMRYYLIRDRDYLTAEMARAYSVHESGRAYVLKRYHIENYLLSDIALSSVLSSVFNKELDPAAVRQRLRTLAVAMSGEVVAGMLGYRMNLALGGQDFSLGQLMVGQPLFDLDNNFAVLEERGRALQVAFSARAAQRRTEVSEALSQAAVDQLFQEACATVSDALRNDTWSTLFPGKRILKRLSQDLSLGDPVVLVNSLILEIGRRPQLIDPELDRLMKLITSDGDLREMT